MMKKTNSKYKTQKHYLRRLHKLRAVWFVGMAVALLAIQIVYNLQSTGEVRVLAYATNVSIGELTTYTNQKRSENGLPPLTIHSQLNSGAQGKANHMVTYDYWSHTAPDGTEPWLFFTQAGYNYVHAGENLAYGFSTSAEIINAWMESPGHRANLLGDYKDMGFGITNGNPYQGGENTVVVAFYGTSQQVPAPPPPTIVATPVPPSPPPQSEPAPAAEPEPSPPLPQPEPVDTEEPAPEPIAQPVETTEQPKRVSTLETLLGGRGSWALYASLGVVSVSTAGFAATHWQLVRRGWKKSSHFILVHPALDTAVISALLALLLFSTAGFIK